MDPSSEKGGGESAPPPPYPGSTQDTAQAGPGGTQAYPANQYGLQPSQFSAPPPSQAYPGYPGGTQQGYPPPGGTQQGYPPPGGAQQGYPPPGGTYPVTQFQTTQQVVHVAPNAVAMHGTMCRRCGVGVIQEHYSAVAIILAILFFPLGILCCLMMRERRCSHCLMPG